MISGGKAAATAAQIGHPYSTAWFNEAIEWWLALVKESEGSVGELKIRRQGEQRGTSPAKVIFVMKQ